MTPTTTAAEWDIATLARQVAELEDDNFRLRMEQANHAEDLRLAWLMGRDQERERLQPVIAGLRARLARFAGEGAR